MAVLDLRALAEQLLATVAQPYAGVVERRDGELVGVVVKDGAVTFVADDGETVTTVRDGFVATDVSGLRPFGRAGAGVLKVRGGGRRAGRARRAGPIRRPVRRRRATRAGPARPRPRRADDGDVADTGGAAA